MNSKIKISYWLIISLPFLFLVGANFLVYLVWCGDNKQTSISLNGIRVVFGIILTLLGALLGFLLNNQNDLILQKVFYSEPIYISAILFISFSILGAIFTLLFTLEHTGKKIQITGSKFPYLVSSTLWCCIGSIVTASFLFLVTT